jgi:predicted NUDIX family NTP pyrophosphohydrolase
MPRLAAGLLMYRVKDGLIQVLLAHPGGPYIVKIDDGAWTNSKGEPDDDEDLLVTAQREPEEETGIRPTGPFVPRRAIQQKGGKVVHAWAFEGDCDPAAIRCNTFTMEWPPKSGKFVEFPEMDRAEWLDLATLKTHPDLGYDLEELPGGREIVAQFRKCGAFAKAAGIRTCFHPDQFVVVNSPQADVVRNRLLNSNIKPRLPRGSGPMLSTFTAAVPTATSRRRWSVLP